MGYNGMIQILRLPEDDLYVYNFWLRDEFSWRDQPRTPEGLLKCWYLYWPDGCCAELKLLATEDEGAAFTIVVRRNDGMVLWSQKETEGIEGLYIRDGDEHEVLVLAENESIKDWV